MADVVQLLVPGVPVPKGSRTPGRRRDGTVYLRPAAKGEHPWVDAVARVSLSRRWERPAAPYVVHLAFLVPKPARPAHAWPSSTDVDKLARAVLDGLVRGGLLIDDRHVTDLRASKAWADHPRLAGVRVSVSTDAAAGSNAEAAA